MTAWEKVERFLLVVSAGSIILVAASTWLTYISLVDERERSRHQLTITFVKDFNLNVRDYVGSVNDRYECNLDNLSPVGGTEADKILKKESEGECSASLDSVCGEIAGDLKKEDSQECVPYGKIHADLSAIFNYFEAVSTAYNHDLVDRDIIESSHGRVMSEWYYVFKAFIDHKASQDGRPAWVPYVELMKEWDAAFIDPPDKKEVCSDME